jgi:nucleoid DNA-binding protein
MEAMMKDQVVRYLAEKNGTSLALAARMVNDLINLIHDQVNRGWSFRLDPLGIFKKVHRKPTTKTNPQVPGGKVRVPARVAILFRPSLSFREAVNNGVIPKGEPFVPADDRARELDLETEDL